MVFQHLDASMLRSPILIVAPHPDDDVLSSGGLIQRALNLGKSIYVVYLTVGDAYTDVVRRYLHRPLVPSSFVQLGDVRHQEAVRSESFLGVPENHLFFMCFPDALTLKIAESSSPTEIFQSNTTHFTHADYPFAYRFNAPYNKRTAIDIMKTILINVSPGTIIVNHPADTHSDHKAARILTMSALKETTLHPAIFSYLIHFPNWPSPSGVFVPPKQLQSSRIRDLALSSTEFRNKIQSFQLDASEYNGSPFDRRFVLNIEYFWIG